MFLKKMSLHGFKSFAYPIDINFTNGLTVVVGPNGSGKSNINDALKWVLGEASRKNLRASNAKDMIFAGSTDEKPAEFAKVTLYIDNSKKILNTKLKELSITRKSYLNKDENEYFINDEQVRRRDIKDLFLDTGLGNVDLSIISQGSITKMVESKPKDLREILNEAAGVSRYQKQKVEALHNLDSVDRNLEILNIKKEEYEKRVKPLKKQAEKAQEYLKVREKLEHIELPIIKKQLSDSQKHLSKYSQDFEKVDFLNQTSNQKIKDLTSLIKSNKEEILELESKIQKTEQKIKDLEQQINNQKLNSKTDIDDLVLQLKEAESSISLSKKTAEQNKLNQNELNDKLSKAKENLDLLKHQSSKLEREIINLDLTISQLSSKNASSFKLDYGTNNIVQNKNIFKDYVGLVKDLFKTEDKLLFAVEKGLGSALSNVVMTDEFGIKEALNFLKSNNYGSATFIPYKQVKPKVITSEFANILVNVKGYLGTLNELIEYKKEYTDLFSFLGGLTLIFENFDDALKAAKLINYRFKIVTLEGDIILPGFVVKGGSNNSKKQYLEKQIEQAKQQFSEKSKDSKSIFSQIEKLEQQIQQDSKQIDQLRYEDVRVKERIMNSESNLNKLLHLYESTTGKSYESTSTKKESQTFESLEQLQLSKKEFLSRKEILSKEIIASEEQMEKSRLTWEETVSQKAEFKKEIDKHTSIIMSNLNILQKDYKMNEQMFMEREIPKLSLSFEKSEVLREELRSKIAKIGYVDLDSVKEYEVLNEEYQDLNSQLIELKESKEKLLSTVEEMDNRMTDKFSKTFNEVNDQFHQAFEKLFDGGTARIKYENPEDILESGIEVYARSPGKNVKNIQLYSGGEKSMIAIALIFAINKVRKLPLLILDEVEAALDEANVERFALFAKEINKTTQVIITSHRPGTMEKADILYGVTMEKPGITKILTVKLEQAMEMTD